MQIQLRTSSTCIKGLHVRRERDGEEEDQYLDKSTGISHKIVW